MANIYDYLKDRGNISFKEDPFNEVDNAILAEISYTYFDEIDGIEQKIFTLNQIRDIYFTFHTREEVKRRITHIGKAPILLDYLAKTQRYKYLKMGIYRNVIDLETTIQFSAICFELPHMIYIAFRGTDDNIVGWKEDFYFSFLENTESQKLSVLYTNKIIEKYENKKEIHLGGHSKGGNLAVFAGAFCKKEYQNKIKVIWNNDGPGFCKELLEKNSYKNIKDKIYRIVPQSSIVGLLMENDVNPHIIKSDSTFLLQHLIDSWQVEKNVFLRAESLTKEAIFIEKSLSTWLEKIPVDDRRRLVDIVFSCIEKSGYKTFTHLINDGSVAFKRIKLESEKLKPNDRDLVDELLNMLIENSKEILKERIRERIDKVSSRFPISNK